MPWSSKVVLAATPPFFNGDKRKWNAFYNALILYMIAYAGDFMSDLAKILFTLSLLKNEDGTDSSAGDWAAHYWSVHLNIEDEHFEVPTFAPFMRELKDAFSDKAELVLAQQKLMALQQGKGQSLSEFLT